MIKPIRLRPPLARFLWERDYEWREAGKLFSCSGEAVRRWCLPFEDPGHRAPSVTHLPIIAEVTQGRFGLKDWDPAAVAAAQQAEDQVAMGQAA